ncbi:MAG TPA: VanZ family protein, partial [Candidatus Krumholzibacteria bacterium]
MSPDRLPRSPGLTYALPVWIWIGAIFCASSIPGPALQRVGIEVADKLAHATEYAILGFLVYRQQRRQFFRPLAVGIGIAWLAALVVGGVDELYQGLIGGRDRDFADWVADAT